MPSSNDTNVLQTTPDDPQTPYYRPLLQLDNSPPSCNPDLDVTRRNTQQTSHAQREFVADDDDDDNDGPPIKHEGRILSLTPTPLLSPILYPASSAPSPSPPVSNGHGHTRSPVLARQPTMLENFSRTVRNYVPTSIPVPTAAPSPARVSMPISFGNFMGNNMGHSPPHASERDSLSGTPSSDRRRARQSLSQRPRDSLIGSPEAQTAVLGSEDGDVPRAGQHLTAYPTVAEGDNVLWSRWDCVSLPNSKSRRVLFLGYSCGFQMWDCTNLASVSEVLNLSGPSWGRVTFAGALPPPLADDSQLEGLRPLIGVISKIRGQSTMLIYSLRSHDVVKRLPFHNVSSFASSNLFTVISTTNPSALHVLSSASLTILHTISSPSIFAYSRTSTHKPNTNDTVSLSGLETHDSDQVSTQDDPPTPIYSLSRRLLAFAAQPPRLDLPHGTTALQPRTHVRTSTTPFGISQSELGHAAIKVGGTVLSGMKSLGGMAFNAAAEYAKSRSSAAGGTSALPPPPGAHQDPTRRLEGDQRASVISGVSNLFFSRSAPAASSGNHDHDRDQGRGHGHDHAHLRGATTTGDATPSREVEDGRGGALLARNASASGSYVRVLDLGPLLDGRASAHPLVIAEFAAAKHQPISHLTFAHDGNALLVGPKDGQVVRVFQLRRRGHVPRGVGGGGVETGYNVGCGGQEVKNAGAGAGSLPNQTSPLPSSEEDAPWHVYSLRRGRTSAVIQDMEVSPDGRWVAVGTGKGTVHVFAINPYGGQPDLRSHMDTRIWNVDAPPLSVELSPIVRLRSTRATGADGFRSDLSFAFVWGSEMSLPTSLLPPQMASSPSTSSGRSDLPSSHSSHRQHNFKDVLVFDASGGVLSLRRITLEQRPRESGIPFSAPIASLATSMSLPGIGAAGRLSASPPVPPIRDVGRRRSGLTQQMLEAATELAGKESTVATWQLKRRHDWGEVKRVVHETVDQVAFAPSNALAHAELSTCARAPGLVPRSIYLSHQFLFYTLGEDYHALIRRHRLAIPGHKMDVRKEVEASAFVSSGEEAHVVEDLAFSTDSPHHVHSHGRGHRHGHGHGAPSSSSFDEPLLSAMSAEMAYDPSARGARATIPMLPNGAAQQSLRARTGTVGTRAALSGMGMGMGGGIPIRMMEGVGGMIRREMGRVRGGRGVGDVSTDNEGRVPLEFDEEDEDFAGSVPADEREREVVIDGESGVGGDGEDVWRAWSEEDKLAVDEAERFDDVLGIMDEDQVPASAPATGNDRW